jgi:lipopolysaccharide/colanic/teichoic acid biosynthesis glycosyltransferase
LGNGSLGLEGTQFPEPLSVAAVDTSSPVGGLAVSGGGGGDTVIDLTGELIILEAPTRRLARPVGLLQAASWQLLVKRAIDVVGSIVLMVVLLPLLLITALAVVLTSRGPALYMHERIGRNGTQFRMIKFRSMRVDAHENRGDVVHLNQATGPIFKIPDDPRTTPVGHLMRKLSIDELPQLVNVLMGDMSLVGPRPPLPDEYETYGSRERGRLCVTPGITCVWQVSGRSDLDFETWVEMDLRYIESWTVREDLKILLRTIPAVVSGRGAY